MAIPATRNEVWQNMAKGLGMVCPIASNSSSTGTAGNSGIGYYSVQMNPNAIGSTAPGSPVDFPIAPALANGHFPTLFGMNGARACTFLLCRVYKIGTVDFTATGDKFTHDAATFPVLRKIYGQASQPVPLRPVLSITTAVGTTAVTFRLRTAAGGAGYVDQDGNNVVGTLTHTMPAATTAVNSGFYLKLEADDVAVRDISAVEVTGGVSGTPTGAGTIWGLEPLMNLMSASVLTPLMRDNLFAALSNGDFAPAVATSGTVTSDLVLMMHGVTSVTTQTGWFSSVAAV